MTEIDVAATAESLRRSSGRVAELLRSAPNPRRRAGRLDWTIGETAAHLVAGVEQFTSYLHGAGAGPAQPSPGPARTVAERTALDNARLLTAFSEREPARLADLLELAVESFLVAVARSDTVRPHMTGAGITMTAPTIAATALGEVLVHGLDIARGIGRSWRIGRADSLLVLGGVIPLLPNYLDRDRTRALQIAYEIRLRGGGRYRLVIDDGHATMTVAGERVDCWIAAHPVDFLLVGYQRAGLWGRVLRGGFVAGGPKPWLGLRFGTLLTTI